MNPTPKFAAITASILLAVKKLNQMSSHAPLKSSEIREVNDLTKELGEHAETLKALDAQHEAAGTDADGNPRSPLTGGTGAALEKVDTLHGYEEQRQKGLAQEGLEQKTIDQDPDLKGPVPVEDGTPVGQKPAEEVGGIPAHQSQDPQINITPVGTVEAPADPQMPALVTPPGEPFPSPAVVVVKEGDAPQEVVTPDGSLEGAEDKGTETVEKKE